MAADRHAEGSKTAERYGIGWKPRKPEGSGRGRTWPGVTDDHWSELYRVAMSLPVAERETLCKAYHVAFQTLARKAGHGAPSATRPRRDAARVVGSARVAEPSAMPAIRRSRADVIAATEERIAVLEEELKRSREKLERVKAMSDEEHADLLDLLT